MLDRLIDGYCRVLTLAVVALLAGMVVLVFGNVVLRYALNSGITVSEELSRWFFVWMTFLGAVVGLREHAHLGTDMLIGRVGRNGKRVCLAVSQLLMLWVTWLIFSGSLEQTRIN
jgi:TRAP-type C4-dicarboxylate transport system permease small subunit